MERSANTEPSSSSSIESESESLILMLGDSEERGEECVGEGGEPKGPGGGGGGFRANSAACGMLGCTDVPCGTIRGLGVNGLGGEAIGEPLE